MRILAISDIHGDFGAFLPEALPAADVCLVAGDLTNFGTRTESRGTRHGNRDSDNAGSGLHKPDLSDELGRAARWLRDISAIMPVFWIPGNHDIGVTGGTFGLIPNCQCIMNVAVEFQGLRLYGVSISPCYDLPFLAETWDYMTADPTVEQSAFDFGPVDIVVSHSPPMGTVDLGPMDMYGRRPHLGSPALRRYIDLNAPRLVVCGHIHEARGSARIADTLVVNAAQSLYRIDL